MQAKHQTISLIVAIILILTQALGVIHQLDSSVHEHEHGCELCTHLSNLDHGIATDLPKPAPEIILVITKIAALRPVFIPFYSYYHSRAPPVLHS
jgi:hypothetical protein